MKGKTHDLNHDLTFYAHTFNYVCHSIRSMFRVLGMYNFANTPSGADVVNKTIKPESQDEEEAQIQEPNTDESGRTRL